MKGLCYDKLVTKRRCIKLFTLRVKVYSCVSLFGVLVVLAGEFHDLVHELYIHGWALIVRFLEHAGYEGQIQDIIKFLNSISIS